MFLTHHSHVADAVLVQKLWSLYEAGYQGVAEAAVTREMLYRSEFEEALADPTNRLWVLWDDAAPVAMGMVATDLSRARYISRAYFELHYPDHVRRGMVHYIMWLVVHPAKAAQGAIVRLAREALQLEAADGALLVFDAPAIHQPTAEGGFAEMMSRLSKAFVGGASLQHLETQHYFAVDFAMSPDHQDVTRPLRVPESAER